MTRAAAAADWPKFQGPDANGISPETNLARSWPHKDGPKVRWSIKLGIGYGGAAIRDAKVYVLDRPDDRQDVLRCLDINSGRELWNFAYDCPGRMSYPGSRTVPTVEKDHVYITSPFGQIHCISLDTHKPVWSRDIVAAYYSDRTPQDRSFRYRRPMWGLTQSPVIVGDLWIIAPHAMDAGVVALNKLTGKEVWRSPDIGCNPYAHVTPYVTELCGVRQVVTVANYDGGKDPPAVISGVDIRDGRMLWQIDTWHRYNVPIPQPVKIADDKLFITGGYTIGCFVLKFARPADAARQWSVEYVFKDNKLVTSHIQNPLFYGGHIYAQSFDKFHQTVQNGLTCVDSDGKLKWKTGPKLLFGSGNFIIADGMIIAMSDPSGELVLAEASPEGYRELARAKVLEGADKNIWAPMALSQGKLVVRDLYEMKCLVVGRN